MERLTDCWGLTSRAHRYLRFIRYGGGSGCVGVVGVGGGGGGRVLYVMLVPNAPIPSLISLMVSGDIKHHVYFFRYAPTRNKKGWGEDHLY